MENQQFNLKRFGAYSKYILLINWKKALLAALSITIVYVAIMALNFDKHWRHNDWQAISSIFYVIAGVITIAAAFPGLRTKESVIQFLTIPASTLEKFTAELLTRLAVLASLPFFIKIIGNLTIKSCAFVEASRLGLETPKGYSLISFSSLNIENVILTLIILAVVTVASILFTGNIAFRKNPLIKTLITVGIFNAVIIGYFFILNVTMRPAMHSSNFNPKLVHYLNDADNMQTTGIVTLSILIIWSLSYGFFRLKEKEV